MFSLDQWRNVSVGNLVRIVPARNMLTKYSGIRMPGQATIDSQPATFIMKKAMMPTMATRLVPATTTYTTYTTYPVGAKRDYTRLGMNECTLAYMGQPRFAAAPRAYQPIAIAQPDIQFGFVNRISSP